MLFNHNNDQVIMHFLLCIATFILLCSLNYNHHRLKDFHRHIGSYLWVDILYHKFLNKYHLTYKILALLYHILDIYHYLVFCLANILYKSSFYYWSMINMNHHSFYMIFYSYSNLIRDISFTSIIYFLFNCKNYLNLYTNILVCNQDIQ